eukprot:gnl/Trimastix_PCT/1095.p1 GENE.gnl/Trimastix_PCT/1095~~gnl/Trimastix_PCT/1095.p1  ORF type:complete len:337 (-),score=73.70 gnl/Trimastix_PCT/1095:91-1101(-)
MERRRRAGTKKPSESRLKQQNLPAWTPVMTPLKFILTLLIIGGVFIAVGIPAYISSHILPEIAIPYAKSCPNNPHALCNVSFKIEKTIEPPIYVYYQLNNFHQNHRRYVKSRSDAQLAGQNVTSYSALTDCEPLRSVNGSKKWKDFINPCGLVAASQFTDRFELQTSGGAPIAWDNHGIAWESDQKTKFHNGPNQYTNVTDPDFIVWMRTAALPTFRKLHRIVRTPLPAGDYVMRIKSTFNVDGFGDKLFVITKTTWIGGKNDFIGIAYIVVGAVCIALGGLFAAKQACCPRPLGSLEVLLDEGTEPTRPPKATHSNTNGTRPQHTAITATAPSVV